jgi:mannose-6-phosphate isomerase-like protein (cupin superfamily)
MSVLGPQALVHGPEGGVFNDANGMKRWFRAMPEDTGGVFATFEEDVPAGSGPPLHIHHDAQELFVVLSGRIRVWCSGREAEAGPGATIVVPQHAEHAFKGLEDSRLLITLIPGGGVGFFQKVAEEGLTPESHMDRITEIAREFHMEITGPPL